MQDTLACPRCRRSLKVTDDLYGREVQCPVCRVTFTAERPAPPAFAYTVRERPLPPRPEAPDGHANGSASGPLPFEAAGKVQPHRGWRIFALGLLTLTLMGCPFAAWVLGGTAFAMANADLRQMAAGAMDPKGKGLTEAARACAIIGVVVTSIWCAIYLFGMLAG